MDQWNRGICTSDVFTVISALGTMRAAHFYTQIVVLKTQCDSPALTPQVVETAA